MKPRDRVLLRKVKADPQEQSEGKLGAPWEGPYKFIEVRGKRDYGLKHQQIGQELW